MTPDARVKIFADRLRAVLAADLPPDAAGSKALVLALLAARTEAAQAEAHVPNREDTLSQDIHLLPAFMAWAQDRGSGDDVVTLVRRFVLGERAPSTWASPDPATNGAALRRARLRELQQWGVDLSLVETTLRQSPTERIVNMERQLRLVRELQRAARAQESGR